MSTAGLLIIGNEILSGKVVDTNSPFLARELRSLGVDLERILTIPDVVETIAEEVRSFSAAYDYVFTSGGIGPTHDDVTMESVAAAFGKPSVVSDSLVERMERAVGKQLNPAMKKMAMLPEGAQVIDAGDLWFPVIVMENVHVFPGIPQLFEKKFHSIRDRFSGVPVKLTRIYVTRYESDIAEDLHGLLAEFPELMLGSYPRIGEPDYRVMLTLESRDDAYLERATRSLCERLTAAVIHRIE
ncbi:MAG: competence/damage-inducible protein A [Deltaproteobacteria bacterium]|jgi:molybdenum cofactor synthesis domain-containing protein|nr:competence/damage-inducible protein A [Deltaproteobacteria bacterium]MBW2385229.1 competence/damage-inducible protein A [Deltaproteobacteria bacterium]MBW2695409.1 competence/damage-inducible protein A [Deltaproteobacteria bacterium]